MSEGGRAPAKAMFGRAAVATATLILYASLATCVLGEEWRPHSDRSVLRKLFVTVKTMS